MTTKQLRAKDLYLQRTYNITLAQFVELLEAQGGVCAICGRPPKNRALNVDHDHKTKVVRGLLCWTCNRKLLPAGRDNPGVMQAAAEYLQNPPAVGQLGVILAPERKKKRRPRKRKNGV